MKGKFRTSSPLPRRVLDFDIETVAAGFGDPQWVPNRITTVAWSWIDEDEVHVRTILDYVATLDDFLERFFLGCGEMLEEFVVAYEQADMVTGHNIARFDNGILNAELMRLGLPLLGPKLMQDTIRVRKTKGYKKGQDVISDIAGTGHKKKAMNWADWQKAYATNGWEEIRERCATDITGHKAMRAWQLEKRYLRPAVVWHP